MQYIVKMSDAAARHAVTFTLREFETKRPAVDFVIDVVGADNPESLVEAHILPPEEVEELKALQDLLFDHDDQGKFIRDGISIQTNGRELDPDVPLIDAFVKSARGMDDATELSLKVIGASMDSTIENGTATPGTGPLGTPPIDQQQQMQEFARMMFLHQIAIGYAIDVTHELPELTESIAEAEKNGWIEVDVKKVAYRLTPEGQRLHDQYIAEAQEMIKRFDIYGDVDLDSSGAVRFDTGLGTDLRVAIMELQRIDPFRARFVIGLNDGEWDKLPNWYEVYRSPQWYQSIFVPIEKAPSVDEIGERNLRRVFDEGKARLRLDSRLLDN